MLPQDLYQCSCGTRAQLIWNEDRTSLLAINHQGLHTKRPGQCMGPMEKL